MKLLLVRHGESRGNADRRWQGWLDEPLTDQGREQACRLADRLHRWSTEHSETIAAVYSSTLSRAYQTACILARHWGVPLVLDRRLRERDVGVLQGLTWPEVETRYPKIAQTIRRKRTVAALPGGETTEELTVRVWQAIQGIMAQADSHDVSRSVAVVSHGGAINAFLNRLVGRGDEMPFIFSLGNTSLSIVEMHDSRPRILLVNDMCHLD